MQLRLTYKIAPGEVFAFPQNDKFLLRTYQPEDAEAYAELMRSAGFKYWNLDLVKQTLEKAFPEGIFFAVEKSSGRLVATAMANRPKPDETAAEFGWLGVNPDFRGCHLARLVYAAVMRRFQEVGQNDLYLWTDEFRLPALHIYLSSGWTPQMMEPDHPARWAKVMDDLKTAAK